ncbi:deoxynucleoside kinase, partial [Streptomyces roseolus]
MSVICVGGMIGIGKTSVAELLAKELGSEVFYESVDDN